MRVVIGVMREAANEAICAMLGLLYIATAVGTVLAVLVGGLWLAGKILHTI